MKRRFDCPGLLLALAWLLVLLLVLAGLASLYLFTN